MKLIRNAIQFALILIGIAFFSASVFAMPIQLYYQGKLTDDQNIPISGTLKMTFKIYVDNVLKWSEVYDGSQKVSVVFGQFSVKLGSVSALDPDIFKGSSVQLGITVESDSEMSPRVDLLGSPFAFQAYNSTLFNGYQSSDFLIVTANNTIPGNILFNGSSRQVISMSNSKYGIGFQPMTHYLRTEGDFAFYVGGSHSNVALDPGSGGVAAMVIKSTGSVGIGTSEPSSALHVMGVITASGLNLTSGISANDLSITTATLTNVTANQLSINNQLISDKILNKAGQSYATVNSVVVNKIPFFDSNNGLKPALGLEWDGSKLKAFSAESITVNLGINANEITVTSFNVSNQIKSSTGVFTGNVTANGLNVTTQVSAGSGVFSGSLAANSMNASTGVFSGAVIANGLNVTNQVSAGSGVFSGSLAANSMNASTGVFTGNVTANGLNITNQVSAGSGVFSGSLAANNVNAATGVFSGSVTANGLNVTTQVNAETGMFSGAVNANNINATTGVFSGSVTANGLNVTSQVNSSTGVFSGAVTANVLNAATQVNGATGVFTGNVTSNSLRVTNQVNAATGYFTGNVGIGTSSPSSPLQVAGVITADGGAINGTVTANSFVGNGSGLSNLNAIKIQGKSISTTAPSTGQVLKWDGGLQQWVPDVDNTSTATANGQTGQVGVFGGLGGVSTFVTSFTSFQYLSSTNTLIVNGTVSNNYLTVADTATINKSVLTLANVGSLIATDVSVNNNITANRIVGNGIYTMGNVGIGTLNPTAPLDVNGNFRASRIGIGTAVPSYDFHVIGNAYMTGNVTANAFIGNGSQLSNITAVQIR